MHDGVALRLSWVIGGLVLALGAASACSSGNPAANADGATTPDPGWETHARNGGGWLAVHRSSKPDEVFVAVTENTKNRNDSCFAYYEPKVQRTSDRIVIDLVEI